MNPREFLLAEDIDAALLASRENKSAGKLLTELGGKNDPPLFIQTRRVCPQEHIPTARLPSEAEQPPRCHYPLTSSTLLHFSPQSTQHGEFSGAWTNCFPRLFNGLGRGGKWREISADEARHSRGDCGSTIRRRLPHGRAEAGAAGGRAANPRSSAENDSPSQSPARRWDR
jgi:hypothetical protein